MKKQHFEMTSKERLKRQALGQEVDRVPSLGGWFGGVRNLAALAGITPEQYLENPARGVIRANQALGVDGMVTPIVPDHLDQIRSGEVLDSRFEGVEPEALLADAEKLPDREADILVNFDAAREEQEFRTWFETCRKEWGGMEPIPNFWDMGGHFPLYQQYGYSAFLQACALYPDAVRKIWWVKSVRSRERAKVLAPLYRELDLVPLMFCGEDLCNNSGPMVDPVFLRQAYLPTVKMIIEPLVNAGVRLIHHCDGDIRSLVRDYLACGFSGLQGFQYELGVELSDLRSLRGPLGEELLFFAGLSVTRTLPFGTPEDARAEVDYLLDSTDGGKGMFLFTSNVTGVEVPLANIRAAYEHLQKREPRQHCRSTGMKWAGPAIKIE
jgi:hypothetical protein